MGSMLGTELRSHTLRGSPHTPKKSTVKMSELKKGHTVGFYLYEVKKTGIANLWRGKKTMVTFK